MLVLGIETSCDDTALALLEIEEGRKCRILAELVSSQADIHAEYGGIVPELASRAHLDNLPLLFDSLLRKMGVQLAEIDLIGVTTGPGLKGCLLMGVSYAHGLAAASGVKVVGVHHIEGHVLAPMMDNVELDFPYLALVVSGGHTEIHLVHGVGDYRVVARTTDDAAGEAFDKSAHLLGFPYPGGPKLAALADTVSSSPYELPRVMRNRPEFSFSGLKTAISLLIERCRKEAHGELPPQIRAELSHSIQLAIVESLLEKVGLSMKEHSIQTVALTGGVAANQSLRRRLEQLRGCRVYFPQPAHCIDNGAMIGYAAWQRHQRSEVPQMGLQVHARWPLERACSAPSDGGAYVSN